MLMINEEEIISMLNFNINEENQDEENIEEFQAKILYWLLKK